MRVLLSQLNKVYVGTKSLSNECNPFFLHSLYGVVQLDPTDSDIGRLKAEAKHLIKVKVLPNGRQACALRACFMGG